MRPDLKPLAIDNLQSRLPISQSGMGRGGRMHQAQRRPRLRKDDISGIASVGIGSVEPDLTSRPIVCRLRPRSVASSVS